MNKIKALIGLLFSSSYCVFIRKSPTKLRIWNDHFTVNEARSAAEWLDRRADDTIDEHQAVETVNKIISEPKQP